MGNRNREELVAFGRTPEWHEEDYEDELLVPKKSRRRRLKTRASTNDGRVARLFSPMRDLACNVSAFRTRLFSALAVAMLVSLTFFLLAAAPSLSNSAVSSRRRVTSPREIVHVLPTSVEEESDLLRLQSHNEREAFSRVRLAIACMTQGRRWLHEWIGHHVEKTRAMRIYLRLEATDAAAAEAAAEEAARWHGVVELVEWVAVASEEAGAARGERGGARAGRRLDRDGGADGGAWGGALRGAMRSALRGAMGAAQPRGAFKVRDYSEQMRRQAAFVAVAIARARAASATHLLHLDDDELFYLPFGAKVLHVALRLSGRAPNLIVQNLEATYPESNVNEMNLSSPFASVVAYRNNRSQFAGYNQGKAIGALHWPQLQPAGSARFRHSALQPVWKTPLPSYVAAILHFESPTFDVWRRKFSDMARAHPSGDVPECPFAFYRISLELARAGLDSAESLARARQLWAEWKVQPQFTVDQQMNHPLSSLALGGAPRSPLSVLPSTAAPTNGSHSASVATSATSMASVAGPSSAVAGKAAPEAALGPASPAPTNGVPLAPNAWAALPSVRQRLREGMPVELFANGLTLLRHDGAPMVLRARAPESPQPTITVGAPLAAALGAAESGVRSEEEAESTEAAQLGTARGNGVARGGGAAAVGAREAALPLSQAASARRLSGDAGLLYSSRGDVARLVGLFALMSVAAALILIARCVPSSLVKRPSGCGVSLLILVSVPLATIWILSSLFPHSVFSVLSLRSAAVSPYCSMALLFVTQHKSGTIMAKSAAAAINRVLPWHCARASQLDHNCPLGTEPLALKRPRRFAKQRLDVDPEGACRLRLPRQVCVIHLQRHPLDLIVSGYLYHRAGAPGNYYDQLWLRASMHSDDAAVRSLPASQLLPWPHIRLATHVAKLTRIGELSGILPALANESEGYSAYVSRLTPEQGLLAEAAAAIHLSLPAMAEAAAAVKAIRADGGCAATACLSEFQGDMRSCRCAFRRLLHRMRTNSSQAHSSSPWPPPPAAAPQHVFDDCPEDAVADAAAQHACPSSDEGKPSVQRHSAQDTIDGTYASRSELFSLARENDRLYFAGALNKYARLFNCSSNIGLGQKVHSSARNV